MIKVYSKPNCMQCEFTKKWFYDNGILYEELDVEKQPTALEEVKALGYQSLPVVYVSASNHWFGFRPDLLEGLRCGAIAQTMKNKSFSGYVMGYKVEEVLDDVQRN